MTADAKDSAINVNTQSSFTEEYDKWEHYASTVEAEHKAEETQRKDAASEEHMQKDLAAMHEFYAKQPKPTPYEQHEGETTEVAMWRATMEGKEEGVALFNQGGVWNINEACKLWKSAALGCERMQNWRKYHKAADAPITGPSEDEVKSVRTALLCNLAQCALNQKDYIAVCEFADGVLDSDPRNVKALYRKAVACQKIKNVGMALQCIDTLLEADPTNAAAKKLRRELPRPDGAKSAIDFAKSPGERRSGRTAASEVEQEHASTHTTEDKAQRVDADGASRGTHSAAARMRLLPNSGTHAVTDCASSSSSTSGVSKGLWWQCCRRREKRS
eukprot:GEMP01033528.1.p1 GENE.GEMP01033528.1~~GEMP01033528.1.p1  ORF type:complete len:331 (+),score=98.64 GEMP01033528.1:73-1065(+)